MADTFQVTIKFSVMDEDKESANSQVWDIVRELLYFENGIFEVTLIDEEIS